MKIDKIMGKKVLVKKVLTREEDNEKRYYKEYDLDIPRTGWVVGTRWLQTGVVKVEFDDGYYHSERYTYFDETKPRTQCVLISFWPNEISVKVSLDGFELKDEKDLPAPYSSCGYGSGKYREDQIRLMKETAKDFSRDKKGRFC